MTGLEVYKVLEEINIKMRGGKLPPNNNYYFKYRKTKDFIRKKTAEISSFINSSHFSLDDLKCYVYYSYIYDDIRYLWSHNFNFNHKEIENFKLKYFSKLALDRDRKIIININKQLKFSLEDYFKIRETGECYAAILIRNKYISPMFYIKYMDYASNISESSESQKKLNFVMKVIKGD